MKTSGPKFKKMKFSNGVQKIAKYIATLFFIGYTPIAPGTAASLVGVAVYYVVARNTGLHFPLTIFMLIAGFWASSVAEKEFPTKDPSPIVIDEFSSMLLVYLFIPFNVKFLIAGFILFRFFDVIKIPPIKKLETLPKGWGIMLDDIACALLVNLILQVARSLPV